MPNSNSQTVAQHYIPRMYLKGFSETHGSKSFVWEYDLQNMVQIPKAVDVSTICFERNLY